MFVIAMNSLSLMLNKIAEEGKLAYHQNCHQTKLTHLSFADDLLIFIDGSIESVQTVLMALHEFEKRSGLAVSFQKTSFFSSGLSGEEIATIQASTGMTCASLPMRYLGVPLSSKKLSLHSCQPLLVFVVHPAKGLCKGYKLLVWSFPLEWKNRGESLCAGFMG